MNGIIDKKLQNLKDETIISSTTIIKDVQGENMTKLYSKVVDNGSTDTKQDRNVVESKVNENHVLLLKVKEDVNITDENDWQAVNESIKQNISNLNVSFYKTKEKSGHVVIGFPDKATLDEAEKKISSDDNLSAKFTTRTPKKMLPKITITGVNKALFTGGNGDAEFTDNREHYKQAVKMDIMQRNPFLQPLIDNEHTFDVVVVKEEVQSYTVVIKVSPEVRNLINNHGNKLFVSLGRCDVKDRYHYTQCFHCQKLGHISTKCPDKEKASICMYCAESHISKQCPVKANKESHKCSNCLHSKSINIRNNANTHNSVSSKCPTIERECKKLAENTLTLGKNC